ncbi:MAG: hypothetical protein IJC39_02435 [Firmicutes bacterium]|nr:hypothetical protein [Bacillota bacterium]
MSIEWKSAGIYPAEVDCGAGFIISVGVKFSPTLWSADGYQLFSAEGYPLLYNEGE